MPAAPRLRFSQTTSEAEMANNENDMTLQFGADASGATAGAAEVRGAVQSIAPMVAALNAQMASLNATTTRMAESMAAMAGATAKSQAEIAKEEISLKSLVSTANEARESLVGMGEALMAIFAVKEIIDFGKSLGETAEKAVHLGQAFGMSITEVQNMESMAAQAGVSTDALGTAMTRLDKALGAAKDGGKLQSEVFKQLGIDITVPRTQTELFQTTLAALGQIQDPFERVSDASKLFGRNIQSIAPLIGLTQDKLNEMNGVTEAFGAVNATAAQKGLALADAMNINKVAGQGMGNVFMDALAPAFTEIVKGVNNLAMAFITSYKEGGAAKDVMIVLADTFKVLDLAVDSVVTTVEMFADALVGAYNIGHDVSANIAAIFNNLAIQLTDTFKQLGHVLVLALTGYGDEIAASMADYKAKTIAVTQAIANDFKSMGTDVAADSKTMYDKLLADGKNYVDRQKALMFGGKLAPVPTATQTGNGGEGKGAKDTGQETDMEKWEAALQAKHEASKDFWNDDLAGDILFWQMKLSLVDKGSKEEAAIDTKIYELKKQQAHQTRDELVAADKATMTSGLETAKAKLTATIDGLDAEAAAIEGAAKRGEISQADAGAQLAAILEQKKAAEQTYADAVTVIQDKEFDDLSKLYVNDKVAYQKLLDDKKAADAKAAADKQIADAAANLNKVELEQQTADKVKAAWDKNVGGIVNDFAQGMLQMARGSETFSQMANRALESVEEKGVTSAAKMLTNWLFTQKQKLAAAIAGDQGTVASQAAADAQSKTITGMAALRQIEADAAAAASGAYRAIVGIPVIGPILAPAAAAAAFGGVMVFEGLLNSAAGGWDNVPMDGMLTQLHRQEMVLPASIASPLRSMLASGGSGETAMAGMGGDTHFHLSITTPDGHSVQRWFDQHGDKIVKTLRSQARQNISLKAA
jgi:hypothetical protein